MNKRPIMIAAVSMLGGCFFILYGKRILLLIPLLLIPFIFYKREGKRCAILLCVTVLAFVSGAVSAGIRQSDYDKGYSAVNSAGNVTLYGRLVRKERTASGIRHYISLRGSAGLKAVFTSTDDMLRTGDMIRVSGAVREMEPARNPGCFDQKAYYRSLSVITEINDPSPATIRRSLLPFAELLYILKYRLLYVFTAALPGEEGTLLASLTIGTKGLLDSDVKELLTDAGLSHILAISGLHISIVGGLVFKALKRLLVPVRISAVFSSLLVTIYAFSISDSVSAKRAVAMYLIYMLSKLAVDKTDTLTSLSAAAILICLTDPLQISGPAFAMSFSAIFFIALFATPAGKCYSLYTDLRWENRHRKEKGRRHIPSLAEDTALALISSFCIQISMGAICASYFYSFPLAACILNVIVLPLLPFLLVAGLAGGFAGLFSTLMARIILFPCHLILYLYELFSSGFKGLTLSSVVTGRIGPAKILVCLLIVILISLALRLQYRRLFTMRFTKRTWSKLKLFPVFGSGRTFTVFTVLSLLLIAILSHPAHSDSFAMLDVGQGDGMMLTSSDGRCFMFDGGSSSSSSIGKNVIIPSLKYRGISSIEGYFLTHLDDDHISGFVELAKNGYPIRRLYLSSGIEKDEKLTMIEELCRKSGIAISYLNGGDRLSCRLFTIETLFPDNVSDFEGANENSLVTLITIRPDNGKSIRIIETGDIGADQEKYILKRYGSKIRKSPGERLILKSAHHGSNYSNCEEWLSATDPDLVIISAGAGNRYGHPGSDTLSRLKEKGIPYLCTIDSGQIMLLESGEISTALSH